MKERLYPRHIAIMLHMAQTGVIAFSLARLAANYYGTNGWISILILGAVATFNIFLISIVNRMGEGQSIFTILERSIPRWILMPMYVLMMAFLAMLGSVIGKFYIFLFQLIAFPTASSLILNIAFDVLIFLLLIKGIYNIGKAATIFFCLLIWMIWLLFVFSGDFEFVRLTPFLFKGGEHMLVGSVHMYSAFVGYELSLFLIPYVDRRKKWMKSVYIANAMTVTIYVTYVLLSFGFFSLDQLKHTMFPALNMLAYVQLPIIERLENLLFSFFLFPSIITCTLYMWSARESLLQIIPRANSRLLAVLIIFASFMISTIPDTFMKIGDWLTFMTYCQIIFAFGLPLLLIILLIFQKSKGGKSLV